MMNTRVLELLKNPKIIQSEDLSLLKKEINSFPYIQNIRALHLYGVHLFDKDNYQKELTTTAAYTTDKKILYQLINGKTATIQNPQPAEGVTAVDAKAEESSVPKTEEPAVVDVKSTAAKYDYEAVSEALLSPRPEIKVVYVNGERNRILYEGEENFMDKDNKEVIDLESTLESGIIVTQKQPASEENTAEAEEVVTEETETFEVESVKAEETAAEDQAGSHFEELETPENLNIETVLDGNLSESREEEIVKDDAELSFIEIESFHSPSGTQEDKTDLQADYQKEGSDEVTAVLNTETIIEEDKIESERVAEKINDDAELSFHKTDSFLPEVKMEASRAEEERVFEISKTPVTKHEDEMRRLIEEVERKMNEQKMQEEQKAPVDEEEVGSEISFAETQAFHIGEEQKAAEEVVVKIAESIVEEELEEKVSEIDEEKEEATETIEAQKEVVSTWKPMSLEINTPDAFITTETKPLEEIQPKQNAEPVSEKAPEIKEEAPVIEETPAAEDLTETTPVGNEDPKPETVEEDVPVMNVSFFGSDISSLSLRKEEKKEEQQAPEKTENENEKSQHLDSNVPGFINTWQSWLKIDRSDEIKKEKVEIKNKAIESFIENNPKISQLKDEVNFVVKEKTDDISHLMTETLANLYVEQKLYTKAIQAFQILVGKHPHRKEYFENKIQEIKDSRSKN